MVVAFTIDCADKGFPLSHRRLKEHIDSIIQAHKGPEFEGIGHNYTQKFVTWNSDCLKTKWGSPLESKRANAANPSTNKIYFNLLKEALDKYKFNPQDMYLRS